MGQRVAELHDPCSRIQPTIITDAASFVAVLAGDQVVYTAGQSVVALDRFTGAKRWVQFLKNEGFDVGLAADAHTVYAGSTNLGILALDMRSGEVRWRQIVRASIISLVSMFDGRIYTLGSGQLWVLDKSSGKPAWHGFPPEYEAGDRGSVYLGSVGVGGGYMIGVGSRKIYCLAL